MPIYEYRCQECQQIFEQWQKDYSDQDKACPVCGGRSQRLISNTSFVLKGSGWYVTDYCKNEASSGGNGKKAEKTESKVDTPTKDTTTKSESSGSTTSGTASSGSTASSTE
ncbi:FmdB family zinc ribbon protein [Desulfonatronum thioautotrophicum]|uniref:FmdB family zinc ribbon protein n=1 Tax=Desulfonatronum thioautotrophicum TaxID=617001 RepID=UPI0005EBC590|nr:zinc ribbon domain-containing protein [Desulfonatronum thioautotrophicum]